MSNPRSILEHATGLTSLFFAALLASGCASGDRYVRPADPSQTSYIQTPAQVESAPPVSLGEEPPDAWWSLLGSDQVNQLVLLALKNNQSLAGARAHLAAARERIRAARGAWYPQVDASAGVQQTRFGATVLGSLAKEFPLFSAYAAGPEVSYDLDVFGGTRARVAQAGAVAQYESAELGAVALSVSGNVVIELLEIATVRAQIRVVEEIVADDAHMLGLIRAAREAGAVSAMDVLSAQSQADHDRTLLPPLHQQLSAAQDALANLTGVAPADWTPIEMDLDAIRLAEKLPMVLPSELVRRRPDIGAAEAQLHAASAAVGVATADMYPHFTLTAQIGEQGLLGGGPSETAWNLVGGLTAPIFHGGALMAQRRAAQDEYQAALATYQQAVLNAFSQVANTLQSLANDADSLRTQRQALDSATASLDLTRQGYAAGNAGYLQVLDAQRLHQQAQLGVVQASSQRCVDAVKLLLAAGGRIDAPNRDQTLRQVSQVPNAARIP